MALSPEEKKVLKKIFPEFFKEAGKEEETLSKIKQILSEEMPEAESEMPEEEMPMEKEMPMMKHEGQMMGKEKPVKSIEDIRARHKKRMAATEME